MIVMNDNFEDKVLYEIRKKIAISNFEKQQISSKNQHTHLINNKIWRYCNMKKRVIVTICTTVILVSGVVLANNIENIKKFFGGGLDDGVQTAAENGYIANPEMNYIESNTTVADAGTILENIPTEVKIDNFMMDDLNLNVEFDFKFDEQIKNVFDLDNLHNIDLNDLIVRDEENHILYAGSDKEAFEKYCNNHNLDYTFGEFNENYLNCGLQWYPFSHDKNSNSVKLAYNMYADTYPKSKKLYFTFGKIKLIDESKENIVTLKGIWNIDLDVPENMYNRTTENYKLVSCDNKDFNIYASKVSDTGFEIGVTINNIERPEYPAEIKEVEMEIWSKYKGIVEQTKANEEFREYLKNHPLLLEKYIQYFDKVEPITIQNTQTSSILRATDTSNIEKSQQSYVENSNGQKFYCTFSPSRKQNSNFIDGNKFDFYETFSMTKYDSTDKIKAVLYYYGEPVTIELEKVK